MTTRPVDIFLASYRRPEKLARMIESVRDTAYPARVLVGAGDFETVRTCERYPGLVECVYSTRANLRKGCNSPLNLVFGTLVERDALFCTDDVVFASDALDVAMATLDGNFPEGDGVVGLAQSNIRCGYELAFPLMGRAFVARFRAMGRGDIFFPGYSHGYNDSEIGQTIRHLGNWVFEPRARLVHAHPEFGGTEDETHHHGRANEHADDAVWRARRLTGALWGIDDPGECA
ncbi:MAG: glycosyltransferase family 2 protein [Phycisphaerales bacterium]